MDELVCIIPYFKFYSDRYTEKNYWTAVRDIRRQHVRAVTVEFGYKGKFFLPEGPDYIRVSGESMLWQKEALINYAASKLVDDYKIIAWIDSGVMLDDLWVAETIEKLKEYDVIQLFKWGNHYIENGKLEFKKAGLAHLMQTEGTVKIGSRPIDPGAAWAAKSRFFKECGMYPFNIIGGGDTFFCEGMFGNLEFANHYIQGNERKCLDEWSEKVRSHNYKIGYLETCEYHHLYHGSYESRGYHNRHQVTSKDAFDPYNDVKIVEGGAIEWASNKKALHRELEIFFYCKEHGVPYDSTTSNFFSNIPVRPSIKFQKKNTGKVWGFHHCRYGVRSYTIESILPILDHRNLIAAGDTILIPDIYSYPIDLMRRLMPTVTFKIVERCEPREDATINYLDSQKHTEAVRDCCNHLMKHIQPPWNIIGDPTFFLQFKLRKRRWMPICESIQELVNGLQRLIPGSSVILSLNPGLEERDAPNIKNVYKAYDKSFEETLALAMMADYAIYIHGNGMIFPQIAGLPSVQIGHLNIPAGGHFNPRTICIAEESPDLEKYNGIAPEWRNEHWDADINLITPQRVIIAVEQLIAEMKQRGYKTKPKCLT